MVITRLHVFLLVIVLLVAGVVVWIINASASHPAGPAKSLLETPRVKTALLPPTPVPKAKPVVPKTPVNPIMASAEDYVVQKGDTLWTIALHHTPPKNGSAWVGLWKANRSKIKNFDRLEVGWSLTVPTVAQAYATAFWKPSPAAFVETPRADLAVDVAQLPGALEADGADLQSLGFSDDLALALKDPQDLSVDLAELPVPRDVPESSYTTTALKPPVPAFWGKPSYR